MDRKQHWETVYKTKSDQDVGWYQEHPVTSLKLIEKYSEQKDLPVIDVGGGNSHLSRVLFENGYTDLTVLDLSSEAIKRSQSRIDNSHQINWIESDVLQFESNTHFQIWHDRAVFHFLLAGDEIKKYAEVATAQIAAGGYLILGTFAETGPTSCSGLPITQYSDEKLHKVFKDSFNLIETFEEVHTTPSGNPQNFTWAVFLKK